MEEVADEVIAHVTGRGKPADQPIVCASGISPSGPVHLGNLREVMVAHAVAEELAARGRAVRHLHFWDDYDRFRRVPAALPESLEEFIGRPLSEVPDPFDCHASYAAHFVAEFDGALEAMRIRPEQISQSAAYRAGEYRVEVDRALEASGLIAEVLGRYQTRQPVELDTADSSPTDAVRVWPVRVYCHRCGRDFTDVEGEGPGSLTYHCQACGHDGTVGGDAPAKLVWKVDWPMRWSHYGVDFEPGGVDHSSPGSSYEVGRELVDRVFGATAPLYVGYSFVGIEGRSKMSGSHGEVPTPATALRVLEPGILRWQYLRRRPRNSFTIAFGSEVLRLYDEWDGLGERVASGRAGAAEAHYRARSVATTAGAVPAPVLPLPFRVLAAAADVTQGHRDQLLRVVREHTGLDLSAAELDREAEPRLSCAIEFALAFQPEDERTRVRDEPATASEVALDPELRRGVGLLVDGLEAHWSVEGLTRLVYGVPKLMAGQDLDAAPDEAMKRRQREFFAVLYRLLTHSDTGPRLPTLLLSLGRDRVARLLGPWAAAGDASPSPAGSR